MDADDGCAHYVHDDGGDDYGDGLIRLCMIMLGLFREAELRAFCGGSIRVCVMAGLVTSCLTILLIL